MLYFLDYLSTRFFKDLFQWYKIFLQGALMGPATLCLGRQADRKLEIGFYVGFPGFHWGLLKFHSLSAESSTLG